MQMRTVVHLHRFSQSVDDELRDAQVTGSQQGKYTLSPDFEYVHLGKNSHSVNASISAGIRGKYQAFIKQQGNAICHFRGRKTCC
jgi:hypothetical protein